MISNFFPETDDMMLPITPLALANAEAENCLFFYFPSPGGEGLGHFVSVQLPVAGSWVTVLAPRHSLALASMKPPAPRMPAMLRRWPGLLNLPSQAPDSGTLLARLAFQSLGMTRQGL